MTYTSFPFDTLPDGETEQEVREDDGSKLFALAIPDGVDGYPGSTAMQATVSGGGTSVSVAPGTAGVQGFVIAISAAETVAVAGAESQPRVDRIVLRLDRVANTLMPYRVPGTAGANPSPPAFTRTATKWDLPLWKATRAVSGALTLEDERDWRDARFQLCTSTNRPSNPRLGDFAFETDTGRVIRYIGADWLVYPAIEDTGWLTLPPKGYWAVTNGFDNVGSRLNGEVEIRFALTRTTASLTTADTDGSPLLLALPEALWPARAAYQMAYIAGQNAGQIIVSNSDGSTLLWGILKTVPVGATMRATIKYRGKPLP